MLDKFGARLPIKKLICLVILHQQEINILKLSVAPWKHINNIAVFSEAKYGSTKMLWIPLLNLVIR